MPKDNTFSIKLKNWYQGASPTAHLNELTEIGNEGHYSVAQNIDVISNPDQITQGPALANLENGTQTAPGVVDELINYILDTPVATDTTFGIGATKLFKISSTAVISDGTPSWPVSITDAVAGKSVAYLKGKLYYFFNRAADSAIGVYDLATTFNHAWQTGLQKSTLLPSATKEDILIWGHGRYVGTYFASTEFINKTKLDFGTNTEVADICFQANQWLIAVNSGIAGARNYSQIYTYEGGATTAILSDEAAVGLQKIGFLFPLNGIVYVAYQDLTFDGGYKIGYLSGRRIEPLVHFKGSLPTYAQKTLYKNTILFLSGGLVYSAGAVVGELPFAISQLADGGYATCGAIAAPFGTPMIASTESTNFRLAKFSGYDTNCSRKSIVIPLISGRNMGYIDRVVVLSGTLLEGAKCKLQLQYNQNTSNSGTAKEIAGTGEDETYVSKRKHIFNINSGAVEDVRCALDWGESSAENDAPIRSVEIIGHFVQR